MKEALAWTLALLAALALNLYLPEREPLTYGDGDPCADAGGTDACLCLSDSAACRLERPDLYQELWGKP